MGFPMVRYTVLTLLSKNKTNKPSFSLNNFQKGHEALHYFSDLIEFIENIEDPERKIVLNLILMKHQEICNETRKGCPCLSIRTNFSTVHQDNSEFKKKWYDLMRRFVKKTMKKFTKSGSLCLFQAYILNYKLHKRFLAVASLIEGERYNTSLLEQFNIYKLRMHIEKDMVEDDNRYAEYDGIDILKITKFQENFKQFQEKMKGVVTNSHEFWSELLRSDPDIEKLLVLGNHINENYDQVKEYFEKVRETFPNHARTLRLYGEFKRSILFENFEGTQLIQQAVFTEKSFISNKNAGDKKTKYGENSGVLMMQVSCNEGNLGTITQVNDQIYKFLGVVEKDALYQKVGNFMPKIFAINHDAFLKRFIKSEVTGSSYKERMIYPLHRSGFLVPCTTLQRLLPDLSMGIQFVLFLQKIKFEEDEGIPNLSPPCFILIDDTGLVIGASFDSKKLLNISPKMIWGIGQNPLNFENVCPGVLNREIEEELLSSHGFLSDFIFDEIESYKNDEYGEEKFVANNEDEGTNAIEDNSNTASSGPKRDFKVRIFLEEKKMMPITENTIYVLRVHRVLETNKQAEIYRKVNIKSQEEIKREFGGRRCRKKVQTIVKTFNNLNGTNFKNNFVSREGVGDLDEEEMVLDPNGASKRDKEKKILKELKLSISEKKTPSMIKNMACTTVTLLCMMIFIVFFDFFNKTKQNSKLERSITDIYVNFNISQSVYEIVYLSRRLNLYANKLVTSDSSEYPIYIKNRPPVNGMTELDFIISQTKSEIDIASDKLKQNYFDLIKINIEIEEIIGKFTYFDTMVNLKEIDSEGTLYNKTSFYPNALNNFAAAGFMLSNSNLSSLAGNQTKAFKTRANRDFFFIWFNGLNDVIAFSNQLSDEILKLFLKYIYSYKDTFFIICLSGILFTFISLIIIIPIVIAIYQTNRKVLSLFGSITPLQIESMILTCEDFRARCLMSLAEKDEVRGIERGIKNTLSLSHSVPKEVENQEKNDQDQNNEEKEKSEDVLVTETPLVQEDDRELEERKMKEMLKAKTKKLLKSRSFNNKILILRFIIMGSLFTFYFGFIYYYQKKFLRRVKYSMSSAEALWKCPLALKSTTVYTFESIIRGKEYWNVSIFRSQIYEESSKLDRILNYDFPIEFNPFLTYMNSVRVNLCQEIKWAHKDCNKNEYLIKGLKTIDVKIAENTRELIKMVLQSKNPISLINHPKVKLTMFLLKYSSLAYQRGLEIYKKNYEKFLMNYLFETRATNLIFCFFLVFVGVVILRGYVRKLGGRVIKTKGLLNMIPLRILEGNEHLKNQIIHGKIFRAVK